MTDTNRLVIELEFVQCLANPAYLTCNNKPIIIIVIPFSIVLVLVEQGHLKDKKFLAYLSYLHSYLSTPPYSSLILYPNSLCVLQLLTRPEFRKQLTEATAVVIDYLHKQQYHHWLNYTQ